MNRLYNLNIPIIGITGGIASGKSSVSQIFEGEEQKVICADKIIKDIYKEKQTLLFIKKICPESISGEKINFATLRKLVFENEKLKIQLENFLHPKIEQHFIQQISPVDKYIFYDIPLLFEKKMQKYFDFIILVKAETNIQLERIINRDNCTEKIAKNIIQSQLPFTEKEKESDFIINNNEDLNNLKQNVLKILKEINKLIK